jgi:mevalonate kinase
MMSFYSHGKLLLTGEYLVLKGANALAVPCKMGQTLYYSPSKSQILVWKSFDSLNNLWFEAQFKLDSFELISTSDPSIWKRLVKILMASIEMNSTFLQKGGLVETHLEFDRSWGLGSSSTLISNIALWANINPYLLLEQSFGGSGYDVACAQANGPLLYIRNEFNPIIKPIQLNFPFCENLFFVHLNKKKDSQKAVASFNSNKVDSLMIEKINSLTNLIINSSSQYEFNSYLKTHESIMGSLLNQSTVQEIYFSDFEGAVKSLGAWGGDFILASGDTNSLRYFKNKGFHTIIPYKEMVL